MSDTSIISRAQSASGTEIPSTAELRPFALSLVQTDRGRVVGAMVLELSQWVAQVCSGVYDVGDVHGTVRRIAAARERRDAAAEGSREHLLQNGVYRDHKALLPRAVPALRLSAGQRLAGADQLAAEYHTGLYPYDVDAGIDSRARLEYLRGLAEQWGTTAACWRSAGGKGLAVLVAGPRVAGALHRQVHDALSRELPEELRRHIPTEWDGPAAQGEPGRVRYGSWNPEAYCNEAAVAVALADLELRETEPEFVAQGEVADGEIEGLLAELRSVLHRIPVPDDYEEWKARVVHLLKSGLEQEEMEEWSSGGGKYRRGEIVKGWRRIAPDGGEGQLASVHGALKLAGIKVRRKGVPNKRDGKKGRGIRYVGRNS